MKVKTKLAKKMIDLVEYSNNLIDKEVNQCQNKAPEKAARSKVLLHHSQLISKQNYQQLIPSHLMKNDYLSCVFDDTLRNELSQELNLRIDGIYDILSKRPFSQQKSAKNNAKKGQVLREAVQLNQDIEKLVLSLLKDKWIGRNYCQTKQVILMQTICLLLFPPSFVKNQSIEKYLTQTDQEKLQYKKLLINSYYRVSSSNTFSLLHHFSFSQQQWLKGVQMMQKSISKLNGINTAYHVSQIFRQIRDISTQSQQSSQLLAQWDNCMKSAIKCADQDVLANKDFEKMLIEEKIGSDKDAEILHDTIRQGGMRWNIEFASIIELLLIYPNTEKLTSSNNRSNEQKNDTKIAEPQSEVKYETSDKDSFILKSKPNSVLMSFEFAKPASDSQKPNEAKKGIPGKFVSHLKAKQKAAAKKEDTEKKVKENTRELLFKLFSKYFEQVFMKKDFQAQKKHLYIQLRQKLCCLDAFQLKQFIYLISNQDLILGKKSKKIFQKGCPSQSLVSFTYPAHFKTFIEYLFPLVSLQKQNPFALNILKSLIDISTQYFGEDQEQKQQVEEQSGLKYKPQDKKQLQEFFIQKQVINKGVCRQMQEIIQVISHLSWATDTNNEDLKSLCCNLIETITTNYHSIASQSIMRLVLTNKFFKNLLSQSSGDRQQLFDNNFESTESQFSQNQSSDSEFPGDQNAPLLIAQQSNPMKTLLENGFGYLPQKTRQKVQYSKNIKATINEHGMQGLDQKQIKQDDPYKNQNCTFMKTKQNYSTQHWYYCLTCGLCDNTGVCSVCAVSCHKGHNVVYRKKSNFFCDCPQSGNCGSCPKPNNLGDEKGGFSSYQLGDLGSYGAGKPQRFRQMPGGDQKYLSYGEMKKIMRNKQRLRQRMQHREARQKQKLERRIGKKMMMMMMNHSSNRLEKEEDVQAKLHNYKDFLKSQNQLGNDFQSKPFEFKLQQDQKQSSNKIQSNIFNLKYDGNESSGSDWSDSILNEINKLSQMKEEVEGGVEPMHADAKNNPDEQDINQKTDVVLVGEEGKKNQEGLVQIPFSMNPPQFKLASTEYSPLSVRQQLEVREGPSPMIQILMEQCKDEAIQMTIQALILNSLSELKSIYQSKEKNSSQLMISSQKISNSNNIVYQLFHSGKDIYQVVHDDLKVTPNKYYNLTQDKIKFKFQQSSPAIQNTVRVIRNRPNFRHNVDYSPKFEYSVIAECNAVSFINQNILDSLLDKSIGNDTMKLDSSQFTKSYSHKLGWSVIGVKVNPMNQSFVLVYGLQKCVVLVVKASTSGLQKVELAQQIEVELQIQAFGDELNLVDASWLPNSQIHIAITTPLFMKVYDLSFNRMRPTHYLTLAQGNLSSTCIIQQDNEVGQRDKDAYRIFAGSEDGIIFTTLIKIEKTSSPSLENELILVESINNEGLQPFTSPVVSITCFPKYNHLLIISWSGGDNFIGMLDKNNHAMIKNNVCFEAPKLSSQHKPDLSKKYPPAKLMQKSPVLSNVVSSVETSTHILLFAIWKITSQDSGCFVCIKLSKKEKAEQRIMFHYIRTVPDQADPSQYCPCGIAYVPKSRQNVESRVITTYEHGIIGSYSFVEAENQDIQKQEQEGEQCKGRQPINRNKKILSGWGKLMKNMKNQDQNAVKFEPSSNRRVAPTIQKNWLPENVNKPLTCFEKMLSLDQIKSSNVVLTGDLLKKWKQGKLALEILNNIKNDDHFRSNEKEIKFELVMQGGFLLSGIHMELKVNKYYNMKLLNRNIKIKPDQQYYDFPFCDAQIFYIIQNGVNRLDIAFSAFDNGNSRNDFQIKTMKLYAIRKSDFKCSEKQDIIRKFVMKKQQNSAERKKELEEKRIKKEEMERYRKQQEELRKNQGYFSQFQRLSQVVADNAENQSHINDITMMLPVYLLAKQPAKPVQQSAAQVVVIPKNLQIYQSALNLITSTRFIDQDSSNDNAIVQAQLMSEFISFFLKNQNDQSFGGSLLRNYSKLLNILKASSSTSKNLLHPKNFAKFMEIAKQNSSDFILLLGQFNDQLLSLTQQWVSSNIVSFMNETPESPQQSSQKSLKLEIIQNIIKLLFELLTYHINNTIQQLVQQGKQLCDQHVIDGYISIIQSSSNKAPVVFKILQQIVTILTASNLSMKFKDTILKETSNELFERSKSFYLLFKKYDPKQTTMQRVESKILQFATNPFKKNSDQTNLIDFMRLNQVKAHYIPIDLIPLIIDALCSSYSPKIPNLCMLSQILHYSYLLLISHEGIIKPTLVQLGLMAVKPVVQLIQSVIAVSTQDIGQQSLQTQALYFVLNFVIMINTRNKTKFQRKLELVQKRQNYQFSKANEKRIEQTDEEYNGNNNNADDKSERKTRLSLGAFYKHIFISQFERKCQFSEWSIKNLNVIYQKFLSGKGTLRAIQVDNVPIKVQEHRINLLSDQLLNPSVNKGNWSWMTNSLSQNKNERFNIDIIRSDLSIRDQIFSQLILLIIQNMLQFEKAFHKVISDDDNQTNKLRVGKLKEKKFDKIQQFMSQLPKYQYMTQNEFFYNQILKFLSEFHANFITQKICKKLCSKLIKEVLVFNHEQKSLQMSGILILKSNLKIKIENIDLISNLTNNFSKPFTYEQLLFQVNCVSDLWKYICSNPQEWKNFIFNEQPKNGALLLQNLMTLIYKAGPQSIENILSIVTVSLERKSPTLLKGKYLKSGMNDNAYFSQIDSRLNIYLKHLFKHFTRSKKSSTTRKQDSDKDIGQHLLPTTLIQWTDYVVKNYLTKGDRRQRIVSSHFLKGVLQTIFREREKAQNKLFDKPICKIINLILQKFRQGSDDGVNSAELMGFLSWLCASEYLIDDKQLIHSIIQSLVANVISVNYAIDSHQNLQIYSALHKILGTEAFSSAPQNQITIGQEDGSEGQHFYQRLQQQALSISSQSKSKDFLYLLQSDPCMRCYESLRNPFQLYKINNLKNDIKYTDSSHIVQFKEPLMISEIQFDLFSQKGPMTLKTVVIYINNKIGNDLMQLKSNRSLWTRMRSVDISETQQSLQIKFPVPVSAVNLQIEFQGGSKSKKNMNSGQEDLQLGGGRYMQKMLEYGLLGDMGGFCMRCGRQVQEKHGVCVNCGENAYQCPFCRNINYENPTAFLCNECGLSRYTKIQINLKAKLGAAVQTLQTQEQKRAMEDKIQSASNKMAADISELHKKRAMLQELVSQLEQTNILVLSKIDSSNAISSSSQSKSTKKNVASQIGTLYTVQCIKSYSKYMTQWTQILNLRKEVMRFQNRDNDVQNVSRFYQEGNEGDERIDIYGGDQQKVQESVRQYQQQHKTLCFGCNMNFLYVSLAFIRQLALDPNIAEYILQASILQILHSKTMRNFSQDHRKLATSTLCRMVTSNAQTAIQLVQTLERQFKALTETEEIGSSNWSNINSPTLLAQHLQDDIQLVIKLLSVSQNELLTNNNSHAQEMFTRLTRLFWKVLNKAVVLGEINGAIADRILTPCLDYLLNNLHSQDLLREMYKQLKGDQVFGDKNQNLKTNDQIQELAKRIQEQQLNQGILSLQKHRLDQMRQQDELMLQSGAFAQVVENINNIVADVPMPQLDFPQIQQSAPQQLKQLQAKSPEQAAVVYSEAAQEMSEWCKFIKAQTCPITEQSQIFQFSELSEGKSEIVQLLQKRSSASLFDTNDWLNGVSNTQQGENQNTIKIDSNNWLIKCLLIPTSQTVRKIAKSLLLSQVINDIELSQNFIQALSTNLQKALLLNNVAEEFFDAFHLLIKQSEFFQSNNDEKSQTSDKFLQKQGAFLNILQILLSKIDTQLQTLLNQMGHSNSYKESFSNFEQKLSRSINSGYGLTRMIQMTFDLIGVKFVRQHFKSKQHSFVKNMIKSHLKVKKLSSIMKNSSISQCQKILQKMFNILRSEGKKEMHGFIFECMRILGEPYSKSGVDMSEQMYLMDEVRKIIDPEKPEPVYLLNLHKTHSQDVYIRGKMNKNPYSSKEFMKESAAAQEEEGQGSKVPLMRHVRDKIAHQLEIAPELMEMLVDNKIIDLEIPIRLVYQKAWWPAICRKKNPDIQRIPPISEAGPSELAPMVVVFRLAGLDGQATEDRIESLQDDAGDQDSDVQVKFELANAISDKFLIEGAQMQTTGIAILLQKVSKLRKDMPAKERYYSESLIKILELSCRIAINRKQVIKYGGTKILVQKLIEMLPMRSESSSHEGRISPKRAQGNQQSVSVISDLLLLALENVLIQSGGESSIEIDIVNQDRSKHQLAEEQQDKQSNTMIVEILTEKLSHYCKPKSRLSSLQTRYIKAITRILPYITFNDPFAIQKLIQNFTQHLEYESLDLPSSSDPELTQKQFYTDRFIALVAAIPDHFFLFKEIMLTKLGVMNIIDTYFEKNLFTKIEQKKEQRKLNDSELSTISGSLSAVLQTVNELCKCSCLMQSALYKSGHIPVLYKLSLAKLNSQRELCVQAEKLIKLLSTLPTLTRPKKSIETNQIIQLQNLAQKALQEASSSAQLKNQRSESGVPQSQLIDQLYDHPTFQYVNSLIDQTKALRKKKADEKKSAILKKMGMKKGAGGVFSQAKATDMKQLFGVSAEQIKEQKGLRCIICHDGYQIQNKTVLGVYIFVESVDFSQYVSNFNKVHSGVASQLELLVSQIKGPSKDQQIIPGMNQAQNGSQLNKGFTSVSYFNCIHFQCHRSAYDAEKKLNQPKKQWQGAMIRNSHTKCNNLLPIHGPNITDDEYRKLLDRYFQMINQQCNIPEINNGNGIITHRNRFKMLVHDIRCLLLRFGLQESFSFHSKGGGPEHNLQYLPYLMNAAYFTYGQLVNQIAGQSNVICQTNEYKDIMSTILANIQQGSKIQISGGDSGKLKQQQNKEEIVKYKLAKSLNTINYGFYLCISLLFSSLKQWQGEKMLWIDAAIARARNEVGLFLESQLQLSQQAQKKGGKDDDQQTENQIFGVKALVVLKGLKNGEGLSKMQNALLLCLRPSLVVLALIDGLKKKFDAKIEQIPALQGEFQNKMKDFLRCHNQNAMKTSQELPKDYKEITDFTEISHFLNFMSIENALEVEQQIMAKLFAGME